MADDFKRESRKSVGIGGIKCPCCMPYEGEKKLRKICRRRLKEQTKTLVTEELTDLLDMEGTMGGKPVVMSSFAARYYESDGWKIEVLNKYLVRGSFHTKDDPIKGRYFLLRVGSAIDVKRLVEDHDPVLIKLLSSDQSVEQVLESKNWKKPAYDGKGDKQRKMDA